MKVEYTEVTIGMSFHYWDNNDEDSGTDSKQITSTSDEDNISLSVDEEGDAFVVLLDKGPLKNTNIEECVIILRKKIKRLPEPVRINLLKILHGHNVAAWSLVDLTPADVSVTDPFELINEFPIALRTYRMKSAQNRLVCSEISKYSAGGTIKPAVSAWAFKVLISKETNGTARF